MSGVPAATLPQAISSLFQNQFYTHCGVKYVITFSAVQLSAQQVAGLLYPVQVNPLGVYLLQQTDSYASGSCSPTASLSLISFVKQGCDPHIYGYYYSISGQSRFHVCALTKSCNPVCLSNLATLCPSNYVEVYNRDAAIKVQRCGGCGGKSGSCSCQQKSSCSCGGSGSSSCSCKQKSSSSCGCGCGSKKSCKGSNARTFISGVSTQPVFSTFQYSRDGLFYYQRLSMTGILDLNLAPAFLYGLSDNLLKFRGEVAYHCAPPKPCKPVCQPCAPVCPPVCEVKICQPKPKCGCNGQGSNSCGCRPRPVCPPPCPPKLRVVCNSPVYCPSPKKCKPKCEPVCKPLCSPKCKPKKCCTPKRRCTPKCKPRCEDECGGSSGSSGGGMGSSGCGGSGSSGSHSSGASSAGGCSGSSGNGDCSDYEC